MPTNTYVALDKVTVGAAVSSIEFTNINQGYTDLVVVASIGDSTNDERDVYIQVGNGSYDTGSNYSRTVLYGNGSTASSARTSNNTELRIFPSLFNNTPNQPMILNFMNYSNGSTFKTVLHRGGFGSNYTGATVGLWRSTSTINQIKIYPQPTSNFVSGSTFSLYGIAAAPGAKATGGYITSDASYFYHTFTTAGNFIPSQSLSCDVLVVGGGGGAGNNGGGGGGAGGYRLLTSQSFAAGTYPVVVGAGGATTAAGSLSSINSLQAAGGGLGSNRDTLPVPSSGGSGGGGSNYNSDTGLTGLITGGAGNTPSTSPSQGNSGGSTPGNGSVNGAGAGGGGATAAGGAPVNWNTGSVRGGAGGAGSNSASSFATATGTGVSGYYAGGGGGGTTINGTAGAGGIGGGGAGGLSSTTNGVAGTISTGGGGGGGGAVGGTGGSGIVIVRYLKA